MRFAGSINRVTAQRVEWIKEFLQDTLAAESDWVLKGLLKQVVPGHLLINSITAFHTPSAQTVGHNFAPTCEQ